MQYPLPSGRRSNIRWQVAALMGIAIAINYLDRAVLSVVAPQLQKEFDLSSVQMGFIMSAFFFSYAFLQLPSGIIADRLGPKKLLGISVLSWSLATAMTGCAAGFKSLIALRVALGIGEAGTYPSNAGVMSRWFPQNERGTVAAIFDCGLKVGGTMAIPLVAWVLVSFSWKMTFVAAGGLGIIWFLAWTVVARDSPANHPRVNAAELQHIQGGLPSPESTTNAGMKWYRLLAYRNIWAMCIGHFIINYNAYFFITWMPTYLVKERGMSFTEMGWMTSLSLVVALVFEFASARILDRLYESRILSLTATRKLGLVVGLVLAASIGLAPLADSAVMAVVLLGITKTGLGIAACQLWALPADVAPANTASTVAGVQNTVANLGGAVGPIVTGAIVSATGSFGLALVFSAVLVGIGIFNYVFLLGRVEPLAVPREPAYPDRQDGLNTTASSL